MASKGAADHEDAYMEDQQSRHESDSSSLADEKEIHNKLSQIMNLIGDEGSRDESGEELVRDEQEFARRMAEEVLDDTSEDLDLYQIEADELADQEGLDVEAELQKIALEFFPEAVEEEKNEVEDEEERKY